MGSAKLYSQQHPFLQPELALVSPHTDFPRREGKKGKSNARGRRETRPSRFRAGRGPRPQSLYVVELGLGLQSPSSKLSA